MSQNSKWSPDSPTDVANAQSIGVWPLDTYNADLLNEVHQKNYHNPEPYDEYDLLVIGAGAGGLVSSRQAARRGAKSAMISSHLAGGDCLNVGCVPSKSLIRSAKMIREVRRAAAPDSGFGVSVDGASIEVDFATVMERMRKMRAKIAPVDGHVRGQGAGVHVYQGFGRFLSEDTIQVLDNTEGVEEQDRKPPLVLKFKKAVVATGGRPTIPADVEGLAEAPYTTNETLFNLVKLPPRMLVLGAGVVALEMAQSFATFGSQVRVLQRSRQLLKSRGGDPDAGPVIQKALEAEGVEFLGGTKVLKVETLRERNIEDGTLPLMKVTVKQTLEDDGSEQILELECECLLVAIGRSPNIEDMGLDLANVQVDSGGVKINDHAQSVSNPNVYSLGDCTSGVPRLTHMSGEMAKLVVQNALFDDDWLVSSLVVPAAMYTEPEYATVGKISGSEDEVDVYKASLDDNDRAILEGEDEDGGYCKVVVEKGTGTIVGGSVIGSRAGEIINEVSLAMKHQIPLDGIGRNIHSYPTTGESLMFCGIQYVNSKWKRYGEK